MVARVVVIGSSASAGWNTHVHLAEALDAQIATPHETVASFATEMFFVDPGSIGETQVDKARERSPSLVVAIDFLFWFGYGEVAAEGERLENLDIGLELLDSLDCPLLISRFPDMRPAVGKMLLPAQMPQAATLGQLNRRVEQWAAARGRTAFVPMPDFLDRLRDGGLVRVGGLRFQGARDKQRLMQADNLHPTAEGLGVLARLCVDTLAAAPWNVARSGFRLDLAPTLESLRQLDATRAGSAATRSR